MRVVVKCFLCKSRLDESDAASLYLHPTSTGCAVQVTDRFGVSLDDLYEVETTPTGQVIFERATPGVTGAVEAPLAPLDEPVATTEPVDWTLDLTEKPSTALTVAPKAALTASPKAASPKKLPVVLATHDFEISIVEPRNHEEAIGELFSEAGLPKLGGASGEAGWSSFSAFQRCPYLWYRNYMVGERYNSDPAKPLIVGSLLHLFLAFHYQVKIEIGYPITPDGAFQALQEKGVDAEALKEAWRLYEGYRILYEDEPYLVPLAVEHLAADTKSKESCRYDMIARIEGQAPLVVCVEESEGPKSIVYKSLKPGVYIFEHKSTSRRDENSLTGWANDGEILGQMMLWKRLGLDEQFGPLQGTIVNLLGKQKEPSFDRILVPVKPVQYQQHAKDLKIWQAFRQLCIAQDSFPRARANCIGRWGKCAQWDHCKGDKCQGTD